MSEKENERTYVLFHESERCEMSRQSIDILTLSLDRAFRLSHIQCRSVALRLLTNTNHPTSQPDNTINKSRIQYKILEAKMENDNQEKSMEKGEKEKLSVDRWISDYECSKCRHICGTTSSTAADALYKCKKCGEFVEPTKKVSLIDRSFVMFVVLCSKVTQFFCSPCFSFM